MMWAQLTCPYSFIMKLGMCFARWEWYGYSTRLDASLELLEPHPCDVEVRDEGGKQP